MIKEILNSMKRVGIAQILAGHDECTVPLILALNRLGVYADVYINNELREKRGDLFESLGVEHHKIVVDQATKLNALNPPPPSNRVFWLDVMGNKVKKLILLNQQHSLPIMFWTTFAKKPSSIFEYCQDIGLHLYAFVHDANNGNLSRVMAGLSSVTPVVFSTGMVDAFSRHAEKLESLKFYLPPLSDLSKHQGTPVRNANNKNQLRIVVPGRVAYARRDYDLLVDFVQSLLSQATLSVEPSFVIAGGVSGDDGRRFIDHLASKNLLKYFECPSTSLASDDAPFMSYQQLFSCLLSCDLAVSNSLAVKGDYTKVSGAINLCINFQLPVLYLNDYPLYPEFNETASIIIDSADQSQVSLFAQQMPQLVMKKKEETRQLKGAMEQCNHQVIEEILSRHT